jgi:hypothetical protein
MGSSVTSRSLISTLPVGLDEPDEHEEARGLATCLTEEPTTPPVWRSSETPSTRFACCSA